MLPFGLSSSSELALFLALSGQVNNRNYFIRGIWSAESLSLLYNLSACIRIAQVDGRAHQIRMVGWLKGVIGNAQRSNVLTYGCIAADNTSRNL